MKYLLMFLVSGLLVVGINLAAERGMTRLAGILVYLPVVSLVSYFFIWRWLGEGELRQVVRATFWGLPPLLAFLVCLLAALPRWGFAASAAAALAAWSVAGAACLLLR